MNEYRRYTNKGLMVLVITKDARIVLQHRDDKEGVSHRNMISLFGGAHENEDMSFINTVKREIQEELSVTVLDKNIEEFMTIENKQQSKVRKIFIARNVEEKDIILCEGQGLVFLKEEKDIAHIPNLESKSRVVLEDYFRYYS